MRLSSLLCVLLVWEWKSTNGNLGTLSKLLLSHFRIRAVVVEKRGRRRFSSILIRLSFYIFSYFFHYSNWILHAIKRSSVVVLPRSGTSKDFKWKKRKTFYAFICQKSCVTLELASKVLLQQLVLLFGSICRKNCVKASHPNHQRETYFVSNIWTLLRLCWRTSTWTFCVWGPLFQRLHHILIAPLGISNLSTQRYRLESFRGSPGAAINTNFLRDFWVQ